MHRPLVQGGRRCGPCAAGYTGDGTTCTPSLRPCQMAQCHHLATCYENPRKPRFLGCSTLHVSIIFHSNVFLFILPKCFILYISLCWYHYVITSSSNKIKVANIALISASIFTACTSYFFLLLLFLSNVFHVLKVKGMYECGIFLQKCHRRTTSVCVHKATRGQA